MRVSLNIPFVFRAFVMLPIASSIAVTIPDDEKHGQNMVMSRKVKYCAVFKFIFLVSLFVEE